MYCTVVPVVLLHYFYYYCILSCVLLLTHLYYHYYPPLYSQELRALGLSPDLIVCRSSSLLTESTKGKISTFCHVPPSHIISVHDVTNIYHVPLILAAQGVHTRIREGLQLEVTKMRLEPDLSSWANLAHTVDNFKASVDIALVGKYTGLEDAYLSVIKEETRLNEPDKYTAAWEVLKAETTKG